MKINVRVYDVKGVSVENAQILKSEDKKYFYWDEKSFKPNKEGDFIFFVNITKRWAFFTEIEELGLMASWDRESKKTSFQHNGKKFTIPDEAQRYKSFIAFRIIESQQLPSKWEWTSPLNQQTKMDLWRSDKKLSNISGRIEKTNDLLKVFSSGKANEVLEKTHEALLGKKSSTSVSNKSSFKSYKNIAESTKKTEKGITKISSNIIERISSYVLQSGFVYSKEDLSNFYLSLKTKPFVILAGISGTGKTQLPRMFAEAVGMNDEQVIQVPVRPDWTDGSDLLGYTGLNDQFQAKGLTLAIKKANENKNKPYFFILDEMNLARVEHYFSEFLSVIETRRRDSDGETIRTDPILREELIRNAENRDQFEGLRWPENLYLIGTVNMDETTFSFSRKVLDRANTIEMNQIDLSFKDHSGDEAEPLGNVENSFFKTEYIRSVELSDSDREVLKNDITLLSEINEILKVSDLHFAYRVRDEIAYYITMNRTFNLLEDSEAMDFQIMQKVLPRIHGSSIRVQRILVRMLNKLNGIHLGEDSPDLSALDTLEKEIKESKYPRSGRKLLFMLQRFEEDRFTSFWV